MDVIILLAMHQYVYLVRHNRAGRFTDPGMHNVGNHGNIMM